MAIDPPAAPDEVDQQRLEDVLARLAEDQAAAMHTATIVLVERLGLFRALAEGGPQTATQLAARTECQPRLVEEWLRAQAVSGYGEHDPVTTTFWLDAAQSACLADAGGPTYLAGGLATVSAVHRSIEQVAAAFRGEASVPWSAHDPGLFTGVAEATRFPGDDYDLVCIFNALHEMGDPVGVCRRIREALTGEGRVMLVEPIAGASLEENRTPVGRSFTAASTRVCLPSALSQGGTWLLGAQAPDQEFADVAAAAGFQRCRRVAQTPIHRVLELAP